MSLLRQPGDLATTPVAALLLEALNAGATGVLSLRHDGADSRVFLRDGVPVGAQTFAAFKPLGQVLLSARVIDLDELARSLAEMARSGRPQGDVLVEMGAATRAQVDRALSEQQAGYLALVAGLDAGAFSFEARDVPEWTRGVRIAPLRAIVHALEQPRAATLVDAALAGASGPLALAPGHAGLARAFGWTAAEAVLVDRLPDVGSLADLAQVPDVSPGRARAIAAALLLLGVASAPGAAEVVPSDAVRELLESAGEPLDGDPAPAPPRTGAAAPPRPEVPGGRERRQRLLARAMENMGVGPLARPPRAASPAAPEPAAAPTLSPAAELREALRAALPRASSADLFARLGVARTATREDVRNAYFAFAKRFHPDRFGAPELADLRRDAQDLFSAVNEAYEALSDDRRRAEHAAAGAAQAPTAGHAAIDFQKGEACMRTRDVARARGFYENAARADPRPVHLAALAQALLAPPAPDVARARKLVADAQRDPGCARAALAAGQLARAEGNDAAAERAFRTALALAPGHPDAEAELRLLVAGRARRERLRD